MAINKYNGVTAANGFIAIGGHCGVKKTDTYDLALIVSEMPATAAGVFTSNSVVGAPVIVSRAHLKEASRHRGIVINSGNSNVLTKNGIADAQTMTATFADALGCTPSEILVASTGVIGVPLPISPIVEGIKAFTPSLSVEGGDAAAQAIMTTDLVKKESVTSFRIDGKKVTIGGCAKGSGMIHPNMATMLGFITTDVAITKSLLQKALKQATDASFNRITVDGDQSTSDMVIVLANGASGATPITKKGSDEYALFVNKLTDVCVDLARKIIYDGEGATKFVTVTAKGAKTDKDARALAESIARSALVKTALFGNDANWGRTLMAAGNAGVKFDPTTVTLHTCGLKLYDRGVGASTVIEQKLVEKLADREIEITLDLHDGEGASTVWTCDLTYDYVRINAEYRT